MICIIIGVALAIWWIINGWIDDWFFETILGHVLADIGKLVCGVAAGFLILLVSSGIIYAANPDYVKIESTQEIYALSDNVGINGNFYLGSGYVGSDLCYFYVSETENGKHVESVGREHAYVKYGEFPCVTEVAYEFSNRALYMLGVPMKSADYIFTVPDGTVSSSFNVDLN